MQATLKIEHTKGLRLITLRAVPSPFFADKQTEPKTQAGNKWQNGLQ